MRTFRYLAVLLTLLVLSAEVANAQRFTSKKRYWSLGITLNAMNYMGDIVPNSSPGSVDISFTRPTLGIFAERRLLPRVSVRAGFLYGTLQGDDYTSVERASGSIESAIGDPEYYYRLYRNLHFRNNIMELSAVTNIHLFPHRGFFYQRPKINPYLTIGVAATYSNPKALAEADGPWVSLRPLQTEGQDKPYSPIVLSFPVGIGVNYKLTNNINIGAEIAVRITTTDYLDDVSGRYPDRSTMSEESSKFAFRGNEVINAYNGADRSAIIAAMQDAYNVSSPADVEAIFAFPGDENNPAERRGNDGSIFRDEDVRKLGILAGGNDLYLVYGFKMNFLLGGGVRCPKFR